MIELKNITVTFHKGTPLENRIFHKLNLRIYPKDFVTLVGENGAGKSALLNLIAGEIQPSSGQIFIDQIDVTKLPIHQRAPFISRIFQDPLVGTCDKLTLEENLTFAYQKHHRSFLRKGINRNLRAKLKSYLSELGVGLENRLKAPMSLLSGGQRQAVSLIMATLNPVKVLLLDEHTSALDARMERKVLNLTKRIVEEEKITTVMITHSIHQALEYGNRTLLLSQGSISHDFKGEEKANLTSQEFLSFLSR
jgi:putative ABC transport system ATP-binding protein